MFTFSVKEGWKKETLFYDLLSIGPWQRVFIETIWPLAQRAAHLTQWPKQIAGSSDVYRSFDDNKRYHWWARAV